MAETTRYIESAAPRLENLVQQPLDLSSRKGFWCGLDRFDWICAASLLFIILFIGRLPFGVSKYSDIYFHEEAKQVARVIRGVDSWKEIQVARAPAPVLYYTVPYLFVSPDSPDEVFWRFAVTWNALWMFVSLLLVRRAGNLFGGDRTGKIAAVLSLILPFAPYYSFGISSEPPAYVAAVVFAYGWALWRKTTPLRLFNRASCIALIGLVSLFLCRPNTIVMVGIAAACGAALWKRSSSHRPTDMHFASLCVSIGLVSVFLVSIVIQHLPDTRGVKLQASNFSDVVFFGNFQFRREPWDWRFWGKATRAGSIDYQNWVDTRNELVAKSAQSGVPVSRLQMEWSVRDILHHPVERLKMSAIRALALNIWIVNSAPQAFTLGFLPKRAGFVLFHVILNSVALVPLLASIWFLATNRREFFAYWPLWGPWVGLLLFHSVVYAEPRYMLPGQPGETLMAACLIAKAIEGRKSLLIGSGH